MYLLRSLRETKSIVNCGLNAGTKMIADESFELKLTKNLKSDSHLSKRILFVCFNENPLKMMKNAFYFILKALFLLKIFKFLS